VGDGTTSVVILAAELLKRANELIKSKVHPTSIISGYKLAAREACNFIKDHLAVSTSSLGKEALINAARTSMSSKLIGPESKIFAELAVEAMMAVKTKT
jgi:T-complex protein 1 subunit alpha